MKLLFNILLTFIFSGGAIVAQECEDYHLRKCNDSYKEYKLSAQSRSGLFKRGHSSSFTFKAMEGYEYFIQLCCDENLDGISLTVSNENSNDIFAIESGERFVNLVTEKSTELTVNVEVPIEDVDIEHVPYDELYGCVGIRIEYTRYKD